MRAYDCFHQCFSFRRHHARSFPGATFFQLEILEKSIFFFKFLKTSLLSFVWFYRQLTIVRCLLPISYKLKLQNGLEEKLMEANFFFKQTEVKFSIVNYL